MKIFHTAEYGLVNIVALMELEIHHLKTISVKIDLDKNHYARQIGETKQMTPSRPHCNMPEQNGWEDRNGIWRHLNESSCKM